MKKIVKIELDWVVIPARPDSVNSPEVDHALHMLPYGGKSGWSLQFDVLPKAIIQIHVEGGLVGLGECNRGLPMDTLKQIAQDLLGRDLLSLNAQSLPLPPGRLYDGFECGILDALGKSRGMRLCDLLGGAYREKVRVGYWTGHRTVSDAGRKAKEGKALGYSCIKFKCDSNDQVIDWARTIHDQCGPEFKIIFDPNQRFENLATAERIAHGLEEVGNVLCLEDPLPKWQMSEWRLLRQKIRIPLCAHVALPYPELDSFAWDVVRNIEAGANDYFNFNGSIWPVRKMMAVADLAGKPYWHGGEVDLGILEAASLHRCAAGALAQLPSDMLGRVVREHDLLTEPLEIKDGFATVPAGPGLGVELDRDAVAHYRKERWQCSL
jgi:muconate cycloisomerase